MVRTVKRVVRRRARSVFRRKGRAIRSRVSKSLYARKRVSSVRRFRGGRAAMGLLKKFDFYFAPQEVANLETLTLHQSFNIFSDPKFGVFDTQMYGGFMLNNNDIMGMVTSRIGQVTNPYVHYVVNGVKVTVKADFQSTHLPIYLSYIPTIYKSLGKTNLLVGHSVQDALGYISRYFKSVNRGDQDPFKDQSRLIPDDFQLMCPKASTIHVRVYVRQKLRRGEMLYGAGIPEGEPTAALRPRVSGERMSAAFAFQPVVKIE